VKTILLVALTFALAGSSPVAATRSSAVYASMPAWSPDGTSIVFVADEAGPRDGEGELFVMNADGSGVRRLTTSCLAPGGGPANPCTDYGPRSPTWSPDSREIAFTCGYAGICVINADGSGVRRISDSGDEPAWSPGGRKIAFSSGRSISVMNPDGTGTQLVATPRSYMRTYVTPAWSQDGQLLAFGMTWAPDADDLTGGFLGIVGGYRGRVHTYLLGDNPSSPSWHGANVAVTYNPITNDWDYEIHVRVGVFDTRTNTLKSLHRGDHPSWSPDGRRLAFAYHRNIWVISPNGTGARQLTHH
jgi:Tol biopolymer transport system component